MSSKRKLKRRNPAPVAGFKYERMCQAVSEQAIYRVLAVAIDILWNDFGGLQRKDQRLKFFAETFRERLEVVDQGFTPTQQAAMDELQRQAGYSVVFNAKQFSDRSSDGGRSYFLKIHKKFTKT